MAVFGKRRTGAGDGFAFAAAGAALLAFGCAMDFVFAGLGVFGLCAAAGLAFGAAALAGLAGAGATSCPTEAAAAET